MLLSRSDAQPHQTLQRLSPPRAGASCEGLAALGGRFQRWSGNGGSRPSAKPQHFGVIPLREDFLSTEERGVPFEGKPCFPHSPPPLRSPLFQGRCGDMGAREERARQSQTPLVCCSGLVCLHLGSLETGFAGASCGSRMQRCSSQRQVPGRASSEGSKGGGSRTQPPLAYGWDKPLSRKSRRPSQTGAHQNSSHPIPDALLYWPRRGSMVVETPP